MKLSPLTDCETDCAMNGGETVLVTGFGPFRQFLVNPSWTAAQGLKLVGLGDMIDVYIQELPVSYVKTQRIIAGVWKTLQPKFAVHLGVARGSSVVVLEQTGKNSGYRDRDVCGFCPESHCCVEGGPEKLDSVINMRVVSKEFRQAGEDVVYSRDAGRYLCEFAYYCSLYHGERRAALVHVPSCGSLSSADRLVPLLQSLIQTMLEQLEGPCVRTCEMKKKTGCTGRSSPASSLSH
ncbi:pyroglutamyl-peptidase 1-like isoform X2 [Acanthopagrus latus]|uniref:pyroglutamyl-peptidase 1-like isoform X2 n=2 Tax=Acanthopagrus latus TaxID=8177 RepID=UPI00187CCD5B|nr:pyroglutamyl-peptidase 1-like isoform X2 [Acanthopagrus latus]